MKCETPAREGVSSRAPEPIQKPIATERTPGRGSLITRSPVLSVEIECSSMPWEPRRFLDAPARPRPSGGMP